MACSGLGWHPSVLHGLRPAAIVLCLVGVLACHDGARDAAERDARDVARLEAIVRTDEALDEALKSADDASRDGDDARAASLLEGDAVRAADDALAEAEREQLETTWARGRRDVIAAVIRERRASIAPYAQALRGEDLDLKLAAVEAQIALQKKALEAAAAAAAPPGIAAPPVDATREGSSVDAG